MLIEAVLVDDIALATNGAQATVVATLYEFPQPHWVSLHAERGGPPLGPLTLVGPEPHREQGVLPAMKVQHFGARSLRLEPKQRAISYREIWTAPANCVYTIVLPPHCVATALTVSREGPGWQPSVEVAVAPDRRIFHYVVLMGERQTVNVQARIESNERLHQRVSDSADTVAATSRYADLRGSLPDGVASPDFWFRLLELGGKLLGGP